MSDAPDDGTGGSKGAPGPKGEGRADYSSLALASTATAELVAPVLLGVWLDHQFGWAPWGVAVGGVVGFVGGITHLMMIANRKK